MNKIQTYEDLIAWQKAHLFVLATNKATKLSPKEELFGLTSQDSREVTRILGGLKKSLT